MVQAPSLNAPLPTPTRSQPPVRTPISNPQTAVPVGDEDDYENAELESVLPGSSSTFDPFTFGRPGSPFGPGKMFAQGIGGSRCGPMDLPMSSRFADPGDNQACIIIAGNGLECIPEIDHDKPGVAVTFAVVAGIFTNPGWSIVSLTGNTVTITNGSVTLLFEFTISPSVTRITRVVYL